MHVQKVAFAASYFAVLHALLNADLQLLFAVGGHNWGQGGHADGKQEKGDSHCTNACEIMIRTFVYYSGQTKRLTANLVGTR